MQKIVLIPSFEPDDNLIKLVKELSTTDLKVIVVNDGSGKEYNHIFESISKVSKVLSYEKNMGKGYALKYGLKHIQENYKNFVVVTMDSDGQHSIKDAIKLCNYVIKHPDEIAIGKRPRDKSTPLRSRLGNEITKYIYHLVTKTNIYDTQTGLRCFSDKVTNFCIEIPGNRYEYEMNVLLYASREKIKITEIEIKTIYIDNNSGSHFNTIKDSYKVYKEIIKFSLSSIISFIIDYIFYSLFVIFFNNITLSNILARIISGTTNYTINKKVVFKNNNKNSKSFTQYIILASFILLINTIMLNIITGFGINKFIAKIVVELSLFIFSYYIQKSKIFKKENVNEQKIQVNI